MVLPITHFRPRSSSVLYLSLLDIYNSKLNPVFFERCGSVPTQVVRKCITKNNIPIDSYVFVHNNTSISNAKNSRALPFVTEQYANDWIYDKNRIVDHRNHLKNEIAIQKTERMNNLRKERKHVDMSTLNVLPELIELETGEEFKDETGNGITIEVRGKKNRDEIVFKASDLNNLLDGRVSDTVLHKNSGFEYNKHYIYYIDTENYGTDVTKLLYLTYFGVVKLLISSRSKTAEPFQEWAMSTLFTHQFGNKLEKDTLASTLLGVSPNTVQSVFRCSVNKLPCIYLYVIGKVSDIKAHCIANNDFIALDEYSENDLVYKFGCADDIERRTKEHNKTYGKMTNSFGLKHFTYIDKAYIHKAEATLKHYFQASNMYVNDKKRVELVVIPKEKESYVKEIFHNIFMMYAGSTREIQHDLLIKNQIIEEKEHLIAVKDQLIRAKDELLEARNNEINYLKIIAKLA
jgi:hypothetical protein